jgi:hypothetical protein
MAIHPNDQDERSLGREHNPISSSSSGGDSSTTASSFHPLDDRNYSYSAKSNSNARSSSSMDNDNSIPLLELEGVGYGPVLLHYNHSNNNNNNNTSSSIGYDQERNWAIVGVLIALIILLWIVLGGMLCYPIIRFLQRRMPVSQRRINRRYDTIEGWLITKVRYNTTRCDTIRYDTIRCSGFCKTMGCESLTYLLTCPTGLCSNS